MQALLPLFLCLLLLAGIVKTEKVASSQNDDDDDDDVNAVYKLLDRVLSRSNELLLDDGGGSRNHHHPFQLVLNQDVCGSKKAACFRLEDDSSNNNSSSSIILTASGVSELSAGIGWYLRNICNMTIGWKRGGGSHIYLPEKWPLLGKVVTKHRSVPWSYLMNVCTHSYSLVWYDWKDWEEFIDWMSLSGINLMLAMTGQEEIQHKVFTKLGLSDMDIRSWFNGPAFLTWSRGQNEYGSNICGPLPRSWMKDQWHLQRKILPRLRSLGIVGQLPAFQGNVPIQLKELYQDANITEAGATGWMDSLDPLYGKIADLWMETLIEDFGTDHWYQLDGYFNGGTAPWILAQNHNTSSDVTKNNHKTHSSLNYSSEDLPHDETWYRRGVAAYTGLNRTDPDAIWSFQGFSFVGWSTTEQAKSLKGFVDSAPKGKFVVIDMSYGATGEWKKWNNFSFFGAPFVMTSLHDFGGTDGIKGDLRRLNTIPFEAIDSSTSIFGAGGTPEGINQNPAYYEFLFEQNFRTSPVQNIPGHIIRRSHKRYGLTETNVDVTKAWSLLVDSAYSQDFSVQDDTGIGHLKPRGGDGGSLFANDRYTPTPLLCQMFMAWQHLLDASAEVLRSDGRIMEPFKYDLVNLGREILAQISTPAALNFSDATAKQILDREELLRTGQFYIEVLHDTDLLVATDIAFLVGPWIDSARRWGSSSNDCFATNNALVSSSYKNWNGSSCEDFYEWNARTQITTWNPTPKGSTSIPGGPIDYAAKHWSGLINDYYGTRAKLLLKQSLKDEASSGSLNQTEVSRLFAEHAFNWTTAVNKYPISTMGDAVAASREVRDKYSHWFSSCDSDGGGSSLQLQPELL